MGGKLQGYYESGGDLVWADWRRTDNVVLLALPHVVVQPMIPEQDILRTNPSNWPGKQFREEYTYPLLWPSKRPHQCPSGISTSSYTADTGRPMSIESNSMSSPSPNCL